MEAEGQTMKVESIKAQGEKRVPEFSALHSIVPQRYVPEWNHDMKNRKLIVENAELGGVPHFEHDDNLFLGKREQVHYNVEDRNRVQAKYDLPPREVMLNPPFAHHTSKYQASLMYRK